MSQNTTLDKHYGIRASGESIEKFKRHCEGDLNKPHALVMREMMDALVDGRLTIKPTKQQAKAQSKLYG